MKNYRSTLLVFIFILSAYVAHAQVIYERHDNEVYNYLARMAQKGIIEFRDFIKPLSKEQILRGLDSVQVHSESLSQIEKKELTFYRTEYMLNGRKRILSASSKEFRIQADPILTLSYMNGPGRSIVHESSGINFWGDIDKRWGFQLSFQDINEHGDGFDSIRNTLADGPATGVIVLSNANRKDYQNFTEIRAHLSYSFKNGSISVGQDYLTCGYGQNGSIILSDKAPTYPYIRFDYYPLSWLKFNYTHAWLQSGTLDSNRSYTIPSGVFGGIREVDIPKFMASHSIEMFIKKGLSFAIGESIIYNDQLNIGYLIPIMYFKGYDNYANRGVIHQGSNGQFFLNINSRNQIKNTQLYGTLFVDEIKLTSVFDSKNSRNQLGYTIGGVVTDYFIPYLSIGAEYTRVRPFVYENFLPAQTYTSAGYNLGDWIGTNSDKVIAYLKYTPMPRVKLLARYQYIRKGGNGTVYQQYYQQPQPPFLFDMQYKMSEVYLKASYECVHRGFINIELSHADYQNFNGATPLLSGNTVKFGILYGL
ncbi:MAG: hypothetical protein KGO81_11210 [Bacteroidota bacterium]|nr:hypothetical protein [Bacteroidota bacterium]